MGDHRGVDTKLKVVEGGVRAAILGFLTDPPDSDFQAGYLSCLLNVACEQLDIPKSDPLIVAGQKSLDAYR